VWNRLLRKLTQHTLRVYPDPALKCTGADNESDHRYYLTRGVKLGQTVLVARAMDRRDDSPLSEAFDEWVAAFVISVLQSPRNPRGLGQAVVCMMRGGCQLSDHPSMRTARYAVPP
jgi:hypothetical protein